MRRVVVPLLVLGLAGFMTAGARAQDDAKAIVEKAIKAHGGAEALSKFKAARMKTNCQVETVVGKIDVMQEIAYQYPDKFKERSEFTVNGMAFVQESIANGDKFVFKINGNEMKLDNIKDKLKEEGHLVQVMQLLPLREKEYEVSVVGDVQVEGKPAIAVRVAKKDCKDITLCFDKSSFLTVKVERRTIEVQSGAEITEERIMLEYQKADGIPVPKKLLMNHDGKKFLEGEITEVKHYESLDDSEFAIQ